MSLTPKSAGPTGPDERPHTNPFLQPDHHHPAHHVPSDSRRVSQDAASSNTQQHQAFKTLCERLIAQRLADSPVSATAAGNHSYDHLLDDVSRQALEQQAAHAREMLHSFKQIDAQALPLDDRVDLQIATNALERDIFELESLRSWSWNPLFYNQILGGGLFALMSRAFATPASQGASILSRVQQIPLFLSHARENLIDAPQVHIETSIQQTEGLIGLIQGDLKAFVSETPALSDDYTHAAETAEAALRSHIEFLRTELAPRSQRDFRIGKELWEEQLRLTINSDLSPSDILTRAQEAFTEIREQLLDVSRTILSEHNLLPTQNADDADGRDHIIQLAMEFTARDCATPDSLLDTVRETVTEAIDFAHKHQLVTLPNDPLEVMAVPKFMRGIGVAYCDSPGPLDRHLKTYYMVSPPPDNWTTEQADSFLREYNVWMLRNLSVHEAIPGHYVQIAHANRHPSLLRAVLASGTFVEGWAVYAESVMADAGFGNDLCLKLMQLKMALRATTNAILDQRLHTSQYSEEEAMELMVKGAFQEVSEAKGKWRRAQLTSCQLSTYFIGLEEWKQLRRAAEREAAARGGKLNLMEFHNRALSFGSPPPRLARRLMHLA